MRNTSSFARLWSYLKVYKFAVAFAIFLKILSVVMSVVEPFVLGLAITELTNNLLDMAKGVAGAQINVSYVGWVMVLYFVRAIIYEIGSYYSNYFMTNAVQATIRDLRDELSHKINRIPVSYFDKHQFGDLLGRFTSDVEAVSNALQQSFLQVINAVFTLILVIVMVLVLNLQLGIIVVVSIPITYLSARFIVKKSQPYFKQQADALGAMNGFVQENLTGFNILKLYVREESSQEDFRQITQNLQKVGFKASFISGLMMPVLNVISDLTYLLLALLGGLQVIAGRLTVGNMQAFVQYVWQINQPIQNLTQLAGQLQSAKSSLDRIFQVLDEADEVNDKTEKLDQDLTGQVSFKDVDFQYVVDKPLIRNFNLEVKPGEMVAIVGPTGAGKTTLLQILGTLEQADPGASIQVLGEEVTGLGTRRTAELRNRTMGFIFQAHQLLPEFTALENVMMPALIAGTAKRDARQRAAELLAYMGLEDRAEHKPAALSGGEKQRVAAARALMNEPDIIFADEPTGSLDSKNRAELQELFFQLRRDLGQTFVIVTHDEAFAQQCDRCIHMVDGRISDDATTDMQQTDAASLEADEDNHATTDAEATAALHLTAPMSDYPQNLAE